MTPVEQEIVHILDMIPFFPDAEKRDFVLQKLPKMSDEKKEEVKKELWVTFRELVAQIPMNALMDSNIPDEMKRKILIIEQKYLVELQKIEKNLRTQFLDAEKNIISDDKKRAEELLARELP